jgi:chromosomal replication initiator protein
MEQEVGTLAPQASAQIVSGWARIRGRLREEVGDSEYKSWLRQMTLHGVDGEEVVILLPTRFMRDWVSSHYGDRLRALWQAEFPAVRRVEIRVSQGGGAGVGRGGRHDRGPGRRRGGTGRAGLGREPVATPLRRRAPAAEPRSDWVAPLEAASPSTPSSSANPTSSRTPARAAWRSGRPSRASTRCSSTAASAWARRT